jgi:hypothetical protein
MQNDKTEFALKGDGRASDSQSTIAPVRDRSSSRKRGTSQAILRASPNCHAPAKSSSKRTIDAALPNPEASASPSSSEAMIDETSMRVLPRKPSSRRKAGAETRKRTSPSRAVSPRSSYGQVGRTTSPNTQLPAQPSTPAKAGRAIRAQLPITPVRGQSLQTGDHFANDNHPPAVSGPIESGGELQYASDHQRADALTAAIDELREQWKRRQMWHRAEKSLTLQAKAMCRRLLAGDKKEAEVLYKSALNGQDHELAPTALLAMQPLLEGRDGIEKARLQVEKRLLLLAKGLPIAPWIEGVRGVGMLSLAGIVGEAGDIGSYSNPAKLWKRMGLAVIGGERQRKKEGDAGILHGYNPARRSLMWTIGDCIIRAGGPLKELYNQRKEYEAPRVKTKMHAHNRAKRYIEKRLLRDLWRAWRDGQSSSDPHVCGAVPPIQ